MQINKLLGLITILIICFSGNAQTIMQLQTTHGGIEDEVAHAVVKTLDGNYLYVGTTSSIGAGGKDLMINKMTPDGTLLWERTYGDIGDDIGRAVVQLVDGSIVAFGRTTSFGNGGQDYYLVKVDADGNFIWENTYGTAADDVGQDFILDSGGNFVMVGNSYGTTGAFNDYYVVKADTNGNVTWEATHDSGSYDGAAVVTETSDGGYIVGGVTYFGQPTETYVKFDIDGNQGWTSNFTTGGIPRGVTTDVNGDLLFIGRSFNDDVLLRKMNENGNSIWDRYYGGTGSEWGYKIDKMQDGGLLLTAETTSFGEGQSDAYFIKIASDGTQLWSQTYGGPANDWIHDISLINDEQFIGVGLTKSFGNANGNFDVYVLRLAEIEANSTLMGKTYIDYNNNCIFDFNDEILANRLITAEASDGPFQTFSDTNGDYLLRLDPDFYLVSKDESDNWLVASCALNPSPITTILGINGPVDFPAEGSNEDCDFAIAMYEGPNNIDECIGGGIYVTPCVGFNFEYCVEVSNEGNPFGNTGAGVGGNLQLTVDLPQGMTFIAETSPNWMTNAIVGATGPISWDYDPTTVSGNLSAGQVMTICFLVAVDTTYAPNSPIPYQLDIDCDNSTSSNVVLATFDNDDLCACDPNDLMVSPRGCGTEGTITNDKRLTYKLRFENVGPGAAHHIVVKDALDENLDFSTFRINDSSHKISGFQIDAQNELTISFRDIELQSFEKGYVLFSANLDDNLPDGTQITNQAAIYFDSMPPVITNEVLNTVRDNPFPTANFTFSHSTTNPNYSYDFNYLDPDDGNNTFLWEFGTAATPATSIDKNPENIVFDFEGPHTVTLTTTRFGCVATSSVEFLAESYINGRRVQICHRGSTIWMSLNALQAHLNHGDTVGPCSINSRNFNDLFTSESLIDIYPNPTSAKVNIDFIGNATIESLEIRDLSGRLINNYVGLKKGKTIELNLSSLSSGVYFMSITNKDNLMIIRRLIKN